MKVTNSDSLRVLAGCFVVYLASALVLRAYAGMWSLAIVVPSLVAVAIPLLVLLVVAALRSSGSNVRSIVALPPESLLEAANPMIFSSAMDGTITYVNPATERILGRRAADLIGKWNVHQFFMDGELQRIGQWLQRLDPNPAAAVDIESASPSSQFDLCVRYILAFPPSQLRGVHIQLKRSDGGSFPATMYLSALRNQQGLPIGLLAVAVDQSLSRKQQSALRESTERYRDLFDNVNDQIATLNPSREFLYINPAWKACFDLDDRSFEQVQRLEELFSPDARDTVCVLFDRVLQGEEVENHPLRAQTLSGRRLELEISMSVRRKADEAVAVRCLLRDITAQKQRERRLSLQLVVSQIIGQSASSQVASIRILETLCLSLDWDTAILWLVEQPHASLRFHSGWTSPGQQSDAFLQQCMHLAAGHSPDLASRVVGQQHTVWIESLAGHRESRFQATHYGLTCGWATPVRVGNGLIAVLDFYSRQVRQEDRECIATVETISAPLGQMLARSREEERVEELHHTQQILLDTIDDGICAVGESGTVTLHNPAAAKLLRNEASTMLGLPLHELLHGSVSSGSNCAENCLLLIALQQRKATSGEITIFRRDRSSFPAEFSLTPILENGRFSGSVLSFRDITQRFALDRMKDEFVSTVSHELRTPLTSIRGALGLLSSGILGPLNEKAANLLRIALSNSDRLVRLINDILDLERIQSGREPLAFRPVALSEIVQQAIDGMHPVAEAASIQLIQDANAVQLNADPDRLLQVITNLLSNAIKFSPVGSTVSVTLRTGSSGVILSVIDQGRGIPADKLDTIFDRFQQVDASDSRQKGGSGLGLAICRTIVEQHGGKIWAERNAVCGSTFRVLLPFQPMIESYKSEIASVAFDHGLILIADSNDLTRSSIANQLRRQGYSVLEAANMEQTLDALWFDKEAKIPAEIEAILVDTSLDSLNGWEILPLLRKHPAASVIPIVLLSVDHKDPSIPLPEGADGWIPKPAQDHALLHELARVLSVPGEKARILVVEDDVDLARVIGAVFSRDGIEVKLVHTRQDAFSACLSFRPQLIVLDLSLPDGDGFNVVDWLRQDDDLAHLPLVVYSAREIPASERSLLQLGPTQFLTKARVQPEQLESLVLTMLRRSRQKKESARVDSQAQQSRNRAMNNDSLSNHRSADLQ